MSSLQDLQFPIDQEIFAEVLRCIPPAWARAKLVASQKQGAGGTSLRIHIDGAGQPGLAPVSDDLQTRVRELFVLNNQFNTDLISIEYSYAKRPDGKWSFDGNYKYAD